MRLPGFDDRNSGSVIPGHDCVMINIHFDEY
jgi:hypothetical protein